MKILDIIKENDELMGIKPEDRLGARLGQWFKKKFTTDPIADKTRAAAGRNRRGGGTLAGTTPTPMMAKAPKGNSALDYDDAGYEKYDNPADASTIADLEKADYDSEMAQWNADNKKKSAIVNPDAKAGQVASAAGEFGTSPKKNTEFAGGDPSVMKDMTPVTTKTSTWVNPNDKAETPKYPKGDIRNLGKYIKPVDRAPSAENPRTAPASWKGQGDKPGQSKYAYGDLRNLLKLAGVKQPRSDDDRK